MKGRLPVSLPHGFRSLHARVLAAFMLIIALTLLSAGSAVVWLVQGYRSQLAVDHLSEVAWAASLIGRQLEQQGARPEEIGTFVANQLSADQAASARVLILDAHGRVLVERPVPVAQEPSFTGRVLEVPSQGPRVTPGGRRVSLRARITLWKSAAVSPGRPYIFVTSSNVGPGVPPSAPGSSGLADARPDTLDRFMARQPAYRTVMAVPEQDLASAWRELAPGLGVAAAIAMSASVAAALCLSRSITRPLRLITHAAEGIAGGELHQSIPVPSGGDEVAQLALAFNIMSRQVESSHRALREFLANASHELRTPLTSIQGFSQALLDHALPGPEGAAEAGLIINEEAQRMRRLVEDLLYLSRVESRDVPASRVPVEVAALVREATRRLQLAAEQRQLRLTFALPDLPHVAGDSEELTHLFGNLLENAVKYTPAGGVITVTGDAGPAQLMVSIHNSGSFIPAEDMPHVFERFYRVEKSRARTVEGSGLGLAIAWEVVGRHGGTITVISDRATGTTFTVTLPLAGPLGTAGADGRRGFPSQNEPQRRSIGHPARDVELQAADSASTAAARPA